jgi:hypothetical protein
MQPQPQPPSQFPYLSVGVRQLASADAGGMRAKLQQVEMRIRETQRRQIEALNAGNTEEANKLRLVLGQQVAAYKKGCEFVEKVEYAKKLVTAAAQAQESSQPPDSALNPVTIHGPPANTNTNAALLQAFNLTTAAQTPPQVGLGGGVSTPDAHTMRGAMPQHGHALYTNSFGTQPPQLPPVAVAAQMKQFADPEQRGPTQGNQGLIVGGNSSGTNAGAGPQTAGGVDEMMSKLVIRDTYLAGDGHRAE